VLPLKHLFLLRKRRGHFKAMLFMDLGILVRLDSICSPVALWDITVRFWKAQKKIRHAAHRSLPIILFNLGKTKPLPAAQEKSALGY
jgi:hypothetical protein